ncbi:MAG TPA: FoF1 ATP synthase subunit a [Dehalococcoidia bacterium]|nr:FoF1 ATP synthase subunit a [Dehalococcoidia bacterium]
MSKLKLTAAILGLFVIIGAGIFLLRAAQPNIVLAPEEIFTLGPLTVVNTLITAVFITIFLSLISYLATRNMKLVPSGLQNVVEAAVEAYYNIVKGVAGDAKARIFIPLAGTIFIFIAFSNGAGLLPIFGAVGKFVDAEHVLEHELDIEEEGDVELVKASGSSFNFIGIDPDTIEVEFFPESATFDGPDGEEHEVTYAESDDPHDKAHIITEGLAEAGYDPEQYGHLLPLFRSVNTDLTVPLSMAIVAFIFIEYMGFRALGIGYMRKFINFSGKGIVEKLINAFVGLLEAFGEIIRIVSLTFRLFGNTLAGEVLLIMVVFLAPLLVVQVFYGLELMFALIQAFIFSILTVVFASIAMESHGPGDEHGDSEHH